MHSNKRAKIINDPIYGFIDIDKGIINDLINHEFFQRLRRISQLGLTYLVYPGANHTRFQHALGCLHLMNKALYQIENKGHKISFDEKEAVKIAILLHDIGHSPFSHALEKILVNNVSHEEITLLYMHRFNEIFKGKLSLAIDIFSNKYHKKFLYQLVSSQLDLDRLDYLKRDSFFTGVAEGNIGVDRIINMFNIRNDSLVVEEKGIYSIEKFLHARRLMYWQVYLHKTVLCSENMLIKIIKRAIFLNKKGETMYLSPELKMLFDEDFQISDHQQNKVFLENFSRIDDFEIFTCLKYWTKENDFVLSNLSKNILNRNLLKINIQKEKFKKPLIEKSLEKMIIDKGITKSEAEYFIYSDRVSNSLYSFKDNNIQILYKNGEIKDIFSSSEQFKNKAASKTINKYFFCCPDDYIIS